MKICKVFGDRKQYMNLLLLADEQEDMLLKYINQGDMYVLDDDGIVAECIVTDEGNGILEIKSLAVFPDKQKMGYGRSLIDFVCNEYKEQFRMIQLETGDSPLTIPFYEKCGFKRFKIVKDFFTNNYNHPIVEEGILLKDMFYLRKEL